MAARFKTWDCGLPLAGTVGSNSAGWSDVCLLWVLCVVRVLCVRLITRPEESCRVWCVRVWSWSLYPPGAVVPWKKNRVLLINACFITLFIIWKYSLKLMKAKRNWFWGVCNVIWFVTKAKESVALPLKSDWPVTATEALCRKISLSNLGSYIHR